MNRLGYWLSLMIAAGLAASAGAGLLTPIDPNRRADCNNQTVPVTTLNQATIVPPGRGMPAMTTISSQTIESKNADRQKLVPGAVVETKPAELHPRETDTTGKPVLEKPFFATKRLETSDQSAGQTAIVPGKPAVIPPRQIAPNTAGGEQELKDQLKRIP